MNAYDLTRALVARGCPDLPAVVWFESGCIWLYETRDERGKRADSCLIPDHHARDLWTMHALRWWLGKFGFGWCDAVIRLNGWMSGNADILEAIEAATRRWEARNE